MDRYNKILDEVNQLRKDLVKFVRVNAFSSEDTILCEFMTKVYPQIEKIRDYNANK